jgi:hypothetical protein
VGTRGDHTTASTKALHKGATLLCVKVHKKTDEKAARSASSGAARARDSLLGHLGVEDVPSTDASCYLCTLPSERIMGENEHAVWVLDAPPGLAGAQPHRVEAPRRIVLRDASG